MQRRKDTRGWITGYNKLACWCRVSPGLHYRIKEVSTTNNMRHNTTHNPKCTSHSGVSFLFSLVQHKHNSCILSDVAMPLPPPCAFYKKVVSLTYKLPHMHTRSQPAAWKLPGGQFGHPWTVKRICVGFICSTQFTDGYMYTLFVVPYCSLLVHSLLPKSPNT